jgi:hypothetical protein
MKSDFAFEGPDLSAAELKAAVGGCGPQISISFKAFKKLVDEADMDYAEYSKFAKNFKDGKDYVNKLKKESANDCHHCPC